MSKYEFKLFITGNSARSELAVKSIRHICDKSLGDKYILHVVDVLENPELAEEDKVLATPTLIKKIPPPVRRLVGDLTEEEKVKHYLDIE